MSNAPTENGSTSGMNGPEIEKNGACFRWSICWTEIQGPPGGQIGPNWSEMFNSGPRGRTEDFP